jgi:hypothetical protein
MMFVGGNSDYKTLFYFKTKSFTGLGGDALTAKLNSLFNSHSIFQDISRVSLSNQGSIPTTMLIAGIILLDHFDTFLRSNYNWLTKNLG